MASPAQMAQFIEPDASIFQGQVGLSCEAVAELKKALTSTLADEMSAGASAVKKLQTRLKRSLGNEIRVSRDSVGPLFDRLESVLRSQVAEGNLRTREAAATLAALATPRILGPTVPPPGPGELPGLRPIIAAPSPPLGRPGEPPAGPSEPTPAPLPGGGLPPPGTFGPPQCGYLAGPQTPVNVPRGEMVILPCDQRPADGWCPPGWISNAYPTVCPWDETQGCIIWTCRQPATPPEGQLPPPPPPRIITPPPLPAPRPPKPPPRPGEECCFTVPEDWLGAWAFSGFADQWRDEYQKWTGFDDPTQFADLDQMIEAGSNRPADAGSSPPLSPPPILRGP